MRAEAAARGFEAALKCAHDFGSNLGRHSSTLSNCWWNHVSVPAGKKNEKTRFMKAQTGRRRDKQQEPVLVSTPKLVGATKAAGKQNAEDCIEQRIEPSGRAKGDIHALLGARTAAGSNGRKRSASPFAKLGALIGEVSPVAGVGGLAQKAYGRARGAGAPGQTAGLGGSKVGRRKGETERARQDHGNGGASNAVAGGHGGAREDSPAFLAGRKSGASTGLLDGVASSSGRVADCVGRRAELRKAVSKVDPCAPYSLEDDDPWHVERDRSSQSTVRAQGRTERRGAPEPGDAEMGSNNPENGLVTSAVDDEVDSLDWFDGESLSDDETPDEDTAFPPPPKKLGSPTPFSETIIDLDPDAPILQPKRQPPPSRPRQTADVSARRGTTRVATSRILEASDFAERTSVDLFHWGGDADVAPGVPIYSKQRGGDRGAQRPPWKRERHKAKTHEDHRRRALERKSQLASAGLPLHLEADENVEELEVESEAKAEAKSESSSYTGRRCEVCRRLKKGGCGTPQARPGCLKRLLLFPQAEEEEVEASTSLSLEEQAADEVRRSLGLPSETRSMCGYLYSLGLDRADFRKLLTKNASTFRLSVAPVKARVDFLRSVGVTEEGLRSLILRQPTVLRLRVDRVMQPRIDFLKRLGVPEDDIASVITRNPSLLYVKEDTLNSKVKFMTETIGIPQSKVVDIVRRHPQILFKNIEAGLQPTVDYFVKEVGVPRDAFAKMVSHHPQLLHYSLADGIKPRIEFLRSIGLTPEETLICITRFAQLLSLSVDTCLRPKYEYLVTHLGGSSKTVVKFPAYFSLSLDLRIIPRYKFVRELAPGEPFPTSVFMRFLRLKEDQFVLAAGLSARKQGLKRAGIHAKSTKQQTVPTFLESRHDDESNEGGRRIRRQDEETNQEGSCLDPKVAEQTEVLAAAAAFMPKGNDGTPGRFRRKPPVVA